MQHMVGETMPNTIELTAWVVAAYLRCNQVAIDEIPVLIETVNEALKVAATSNVSGKPKPAVPIADSVQPQYLVCLEDGQQVTLLRRHLKNQYGMSPEDYRRKWKLPHDYPMVPAHYAKQCAKNAIRHGLGKV